MMLIKTTFLLNTFLAITFSTSVMAGTALEKLENETAKSAVFAQTSSEWRCPEAIELQFSSSKPDWALSTDKDIFLAGRRITSERSTSFAHDGGHISFRPGLSEGKTHVLKRSVNFLFGIIYSVAWQSEQNGVFRAEYSAKIATTHMIARSRYLVQYDASLDQITYHFEGNGVDPVHCEFKKTEFLGFAR